MRYYRLVTMPPILGAILFLSFCEDNPVDQLGPCEENTPDSLSSCDITANVTHGEPHGKLVFFMKDTTVGLPGLYTMNLDGSDLRIIAAPGDTIQNPDGSLHIVPNHAGFANPRWSPDGKMIACGYEAAFDISSLLLMRADGTNKRILSLSYGSAYRPQWSPEGERILFMRGVYLGAIVATGIIDTAGRNDRDFEIAGEAPYFFECDTLWFYNYAQGDYQWGPSGDQIYAIARVNKPPETGYVIGTSLENEVYCLNATEGTIEQRVTNNNMDEGGFKISPDGSNLAYKRGKYGETNTFYLIRLTEPCFVEILILATVDVFWNWSNDSRYIVFAKDENPDPYRNEDLYLYMVDIDNPDEITKLTSFQAYMPDLFVPVD